MMMTKVIPYSWQLGHLVRCKHNIDIAKSDFLPVVGW